MVETGNSLVINSLHTRYIDAYRVARFVVGVGDLFKILGIVLAAIIGMGTLLVVSQTRGEQQQIAFFIAGATIAGFFGALLFLLGVLVASIGQIQKATLDSAVNSSPFLTNEHRIQIMSLPTSRVEEVKAQALNPTQSETARVPHDLDNIQF